MGEVQILSEVPINIGVLKKQLDKVKERDKELDFRAAKTEEYINQVSYIEKAEQLFGKITGLNIPRLKETHINKIIDIMPVTVRDLKVVLQGYSLTVNNEGMKKIADILKEFADKK